MITKAEAKALHTVEQMIGEARDLHAQVDMLTEFANRICDIGSARHEFWRLSSDPAGSIMALVPVIQELKRFKQEYEEVERDRCSTCKNYRLDIEGDVPTLHFCRRFERFFLADFYCKCWVKR